MLRPSDDPEQPGKYVLVLCRRQAEVEHCFQKTPLAIKQHGGKLITAHFKCSNQAIAQVIRVRSDGRGRASAN